ncbi:MAG: T9SS type A sorting domain-containing protein, partial [Chryseobacterium sp.]
EWYMVRAVKQQQTGAGIYLNPSQGIFIRNQLSVMPVRLLTFTADKAGNAAILKWSTASETGSNGFMIQKRSSTGSWATIGFQPSAAINGNSASSLNYSFTDAHPFAGENYYRLQMPDANSSAEYSETRQLIFNSAIQPGIYPNPVKDKIYFTAPLNTISKLELYDVNGKLLLFGIEEFTRILTLFSKRKTLNNKPLKGDTNYYE